MLHDGLYLRTLGGLSLENGGRTILGAASQRGRLAILAVLAAGGDREVSRDLLHTLFWPDSDTEHARGALNQAIYALRRDAGERELTVGTTELRLNPAVIRSDVGEFEAALAAGELTRAVELYAGPFLEGIHLHEAAGFERWLDQERRRLATLYQEALGRLAREAETRSDFPKAVHWWRELATADSLSAAAARSLMRVLVRSGDSAAALQHARIYEQVVRAELDAAPDSSIQELVAQIRSGIEASRIPAAGATPESVRPSPLGTLAPADFPVSPSGRRKRAALGVGVAALAIAVWVLAVRTDVPDLDSSRVLLSGGPSDSLLLAEVARGLLERDQTLTLTNDRVRSRARYLVRVQSSSIGDSIRLEAVLTDASTESRLRAIRPVVTSPPGAAGAIRLLVDRVAVTLATYRDPFFANWASAAEMPDSWESFEQIALGLQALFTNVEDTASHFRNAAILDSTSATAWLFQAYVAEEDGSPAISDSILGVAERPGRRFGPYERALSELIKAWNRKDIAGAHTAGHRLLEVAPQSEWAYMVALDALSLGRFREAVELTDRVRGKPGWTVNWQYGVIIRDVALHLLGDFPKELELAQEALRAEPDSRLYLQLESKALAGMGRVTEVTGICQGAMSLRAEPRAPDWQPCRQACIELAAHGHPEAARSLAQRFIAWRETALTASVEVRALERATVYAELADWPATERALREVPAAAAMKPEYLRLLSLVQAFRRDTVALAETRRLIVSINPGPDSDPNDSMHGAAIAALLGDRDGAVTLLAKAFRDGSRGRARLHWAGPFDALRGYPPFELLAGPVEDPAHLAQVFGKARPQ